MVWAADQITVVNATPFDLHGAVYYQNGPADRVGNPFLIRAGASAYVERPARKFWTDRQVYLSINDDRLKARLTPRETEILAGFNIGSIKGSSFTIMYDYTTGTFSGYSPLEKTARDVLSVLKKPAVKMTGELRSQLQKSYRPYAHEGQYVHVRSAYPLKLSEGEARARKKRDATVYAALQRLTGESFDNNTMPRIAFCASGGGIRSAIATLGALSGAEEAGILPAISYMAGLSGGAWGISSLMMTSLDPYQFLTNFSQRVARGIISDVVVGELMTILWRKVAFNQPISSIDIFGALVTQRMLGWYTNDLSRLVLSDQIQRAERGELPYPIYSAITTKEVPYGWVEFTPHEVGGEYLGAFIPSYALGTPFSGGYSMSLDPELPLSFLMGTWGSAYSANFEFMVKELSSSLAPILKDLLSAAVSLDQVGRVRLWPGKIANFTRGIPDAPRAAQEYLTLIDAGIEFNLPLPPLLRKDRGIDIIVVLDNSQDIAYNMGIELQKAAQYAERNDLPFPRIDAQKFKAVTENEPVAIFEGNGPVIVYVPLVKNKRSSFDPATCIESGPCSTFNFQYSPAQTMSLASVGAEAIKQVKPVLIDVIKRVAERKKGQQQP